MFHKTEPYTNTNLLNPKTTYTTDPKNLLNHYKHEMINDKLLFENYMYLSFIVTDLRKCIHNFSITVNFEVYEPELHADFRPVATVEKKPHKCLRNYDSEPETFGRVKPVFCCHRYAALWFQC